MSRFLAIFSRNLSSSQIYKRTCTTFSMNNLRFSSYRLQQKERLLVFEPDIFINIWKKVVISIMTDVIDDAIQFLRLRYAIFFTISISLSFKKKKKKKKRNNNFHDTICNKMSKHFLIRIIATKKLVGRVWMEQGTAIIFLQKHVIN